jgi:hypothetical protein
LRGVPLLADLADAEIDWLAENAEEMRLCPKGISVEGRRGELYNQEFIKGRAILVRFVISDITPTSCRFEQSFSDHGGKA